LFLEKTTNWLFEAGNSVLSGCLVLTKMISKVFFMQKEINNPVYKMLVSAGRAITEIYQAPASASR
jgi:hypothetical protein